MLRVELRVTVAGRGDDVGPGGIAVATNRKRADERIAIGIVQRPKDDLGPRRWNDLAVQERRSAPLIFFGRLHQLVERNHRGWRLLDGGDDTEARGENAKFL